MDVATQMPADGHAVATAPLWHAASGAVAARLEPGLDNGLNNGQGSGQDGLHSQRWHFQHGPIDLIIGADGTSAALAAAFQSAWQTFADILPVLAVQLPQLRQPVGPGMPWCRAPFQPRSPLASSGAESQRDGVQGDGFQGDNFQGDVAHRMRAACQPYANHIYLTPMAAVAGAVADTVIRAFVAQPGIRRAYVNNGGDIALHLSADTHYRVGLYALKSDARELPARAADANDLDGRFMVSAASAVRGIATSGWRGRSFSLGIADSVTVLASDSARADAAATVIANQVDVDHPAIVRAVACELKDDSDLGAAPVTVQVGYLPAPAVRQALARGECQARCLLAAGLIEGAALCLQGQRRIVLNEKTVPQNAGMLSAGLAFA